MPTAIDVRIHPPLPSGDSTIGGRFAELPVRDEVQPLIPLENANRPFGLGLAYTPG